VTWKCSLLCDKKKKNSKRLVEWLKWSAGLACMGPEFKPIEEILKDILTLFLNLKRNVKRH
jgi:hypothetical protein